MKETESTLKRVANYTFASIYALYLTKIQNKDRSEDELLQVLTWLTGYSRSEIERVNGTDTNLAAFFDGATLNPNAPLITGVICGVRLEEIEDPFMRNVRYMDKLVDELAKGRKMEKILRA